MKITFLGTGNALVTECYNTCFVIEDNGQLMLVDGGGGNSVLKKIKDSGYSLTDIHDIYVTHKHMDHIVGVIWIVRAVGQAINRGEYIGELRIYGHDEVIELIRDISLKLIDGKASKLIDDKIKLIEINHGDKIKLIGHDVVSFDIGSTKAKQFGFMMTLEDGAKLTCCGDEPYNQCEREYALASKWLLHEAFCLYSQREKFKPYEKHHSTVKDACEMAEELGVENLILYHTEDKNIESRKDLYMTEGKPYFSGNLFVPDDMESIEIQ